MKINHIATICIYIAAISSSAAAMSANDIMNINKPDQRYFDWCLDHDLNSGKTCASEIAYTPDKPTTIIFHVNEYLPNSEKLSDPVHLICGNKPAIINAAESYTCTLSGTGDSIRWWTEPTYKNNGVNGTLFWTV